MSLRKGISMARMPTVLVVDDDPAIRKMIQEVLSLEGYPTETAANGQEALDLLTKSGPRVVLLDLQMPIFDGAQVLEALASQPVERARHKIYLVSAYLYLDQWQGAVERADGTLRKPFTVNQLINVVENAGLEG